MSELLTEIPPLPDLDADFNGDGIVDAADYTVWRDGLGGSFVSNDYELWKQNFGATDGSGSAAAVPEPTSCIVAVVAIVGVACVRRRAAGGSAATS